MVFLDLYRDVGGASPRKMDMTIQRTPDEARREVRDRVYAAYLHGGDEPAHVRHDLLYRDTTPTRPDANGDLDYPFAVEHVLRPSFTHRIG